MTKILIIDDEIDIANNISAILTDENYEAYKASNSDQAFNLMSLNKFDLIITNRFIVKNSLINWHWIRKFLTLIRYYLINLVLGINYDTSGAYRAYNLNKIKKKHILKAQNDSCLLYTSPSPRDRG